ncbi:hypothetical protein JHK82_052959 [Glycine max]|nr:hypothetical protein JHK87_052892 [Glycine soja]KAG4927177.1 hypothetical protein JHK85_053663 [Glycine max]KAG5082797.1 hypothetical protein JHK84_052835 [Glycine max]KAG5085562.1 hypothetical protein JHK82_052959 [Glycine max]
MLNTDGLVRGLDKLGGCGGLLGTQDVCKSISSSIEGCASGSSSVPSIRSLINMDWQAHIVGIYREANCYVDALASMACDMGENFVIFEHSPNVLDTLL